MNSVASNIIFLFAALLTDTTLEFGRSRLIRLLSVLDPNTYTTLNAVKRAIEDESNSFEIWHSTTMIADAHSDISGGLRLADKSLLLCFVGRGIIPVDLDRCALPVSSLFPKISLRRNHTNLGVHGAPHAVV